MVPTCKRRQSRHRNTLPCRVGIISRQGHMVKSSTFTLMRITQPAITVVTVTIVRLTLGNAFVFRPGVHVARFTAEAGLLGSRSCSTRCLGTPAWTPAKEKPAARSRGLTSMSAAAAEQPHGSVTFLPENGELAVEETVEIIYRPPDGLFKDVDALLYCGGFNGWDGEDEALTLPMMPIEDGKFRVSINVPNFARFLDFVVTDGVRYDIGPDGGFYHALVTHVREADKDGNIITYRQEADGTLVKTGVIEKTDPQELERMMEEATKAQNMGAPSSFSAPVVDDAIDEVEKGLRQEVMVSVEEQDAVQKMRAEASVLGERLGLGNMQVNEARDAFDVFDSADGLLAFEDVGKVLDKLGFDELDSSQTAELIGTHVLEKRPDATSMTLVEFMYLFKELDDMDIGIDIC